MPVLMIGAAVLGLCLGSFINVAAYRLPRGESLSVPGSHCPACNHPIRWRHNLPVISWIILGGRCFDCDSQISIRYPIVEVASGAVGLLAALSFAERSPLALYGAALILGLLATMLASSRRKGLEGA